MEEILNAVVSEEDLKKYETIYFEQLKEVEPVSISAQYHYAWCLVRSKYPADIKKGIVLLENLFSQDPNKRRDYLFYLAIGNARIKEYSRALKFCRIFLEVEPNNRQVRELETIIKKKINKEGTIGIAITMAGVLLVGGLVSLGVALTKSNNTPLKN